MSALGLAGALSDPRKEHKPEGDRVPSGSAIVEALAWPGVARQGKAGQVRRDAAAFDTLPPPYGIASRTDSVAAMAVAAAWSSPRGVSRNRWAARRALADVA